MSDITIRRAYSWGPLPLLNFRTQLISNLHLCTTRRDLLYIPKSNSRKESTSTMGNDIQEEQASKLKKNNPLGTSFNNKPPYSS
jgi:hypothetical protein